MTDHYIKNIEIKDFKCFDHFKAEGFTAVNLIGGKNNVGKTAFMEACYINSSSIDLKKFIGALRAIKFMRENLNLILESSGVSTQQYIEQCNNISVRTNINITSFNISENEGIKEYIFNYANEPKVKVNINDFSFESNYSDKVSFIDNFGLCNNEIIGFYSSVQKKDDEEYINKSLTEFDPMISAFKIIDEVPQCKTNGKYLELTELGDGVRHFVSIVTAFYNSENGHLFIDEIDNGIHYTMLDNIWNTIIRLSNELNVQVFATTHSKECIESFNRVQVELNNNQSSYFELAKAKNKGKIFMRSLDKDQLAYELSHQGRYRGE